MMHCNTDLAEQDDSKNIGDIYDGEVYKQLANGILLSSNNISLKHNSDGIAVFRLSGKDVWPIFLQINELPPNMR